MTTERSASLFDTARGLFPGGVNSPVRAFGGVGGTPRFMERGEGPWLIDADGNRYADYIGSWGPMIVGHAHPEVIEKVQARVAHSLGFGTPTGVESELAGKVRTFFPAMERLRFVSSGTEATMSAIRLARGFTGRERILKFEGCYHGHYDGLLVRSGSGALTFGVPDSAGVPRALAELTLTAPYNDPDAVRAAFEAHGDDLAAVIVEPIAGNMNMVTPRDGFLQTLRELCTQHGTLLILDEVMTGFRVAPGGAQSLYGVTPDLTALGKVVGGGLAVGAFGGRADVMGHLAPEGPVYQAGTLSGNPVAMEAGLATLSILEREQPWPALAEHSRALVAGMVEAAREHGFRAAGEAVGGMFGFFLGIDETPRDLAEVKAADAELFKHFFHAMLDRGVYLAPSAFEAGFVSMAHDEEVIRTTVRAARDAFAALAAAR
jgi:glutamate-1-semialdehyde 2,1-aminomutase